MESYIDAGERFVLVRTSFKPPQQVQALALRVDGSLIAFESAAADFGAESEPARAVVLRGDNKYIAAGDLTAGPGGEAVLQLTSAWQVMNRRRNSRYATRMAATVICLESHASQQGRVLDVSHGGLRVELPVQPGPGSLLIKLNWQRKAVLLPAAVAGWDDTDDGGQLRVKFGELDPEQRRFIDELIEFLATEARAA
ncbi:MAG: PilZ domain-containing protein [Dehalococcoidia bacterium]